MKARGVDVPQTPACVLGEIDLVRALALAGIHSVVVAPAGDFSRHSRFTTSCIDPLDARTQPEALLARLLGFGRSCPSKPVLFYDGDSALLFVSRYRDALRECFRFVVPGAELVEDLVDKVRFQRLCLELGLPAPASSVLSPGSGTGALPDEYPVIVKPLPNRTAAWESLADGKAILVGSRADLDVLAARLHEAGVEALVQVAVPGPETLIESYHAYVADDREIVGEFSGRKLRTFPQQFGYSTAVEIKHSPDVLELGRSIMAKLQFTGVAKFDLKRDPRDGALHLLEINARFNLWHYPGAAAGVNLPSLVYDDLTGGRRSGTVRACDGVTWCNPWHDWRAVRAEGQSVVRWVPWLIRCDTKHSFAWNDPEPLLRSALERVGKRLRPGMRRQRPGG